MDVFGDAHAQDVDAEDVAALLESDRVASAAAAAAARGDAPDDAARDALDRDGGGSDGDAIAAVFRGCAFAIVLAPATSRVSSRRANENDDAFDDDAFDEEALARARAWEAEKTKALPSSRDEARSAAAAIARRDVAGDPAAHLPSPFGEAARLAAGLAVSLRLRGASVSDGSERNREDDDAAGRDGGKHTHVLVVTPDGFSRAPAARAGLDGARFGVGGHATWVNAAWVRARMDAGKPVVS